jgi:uncharacterized protein DUF5666
VRTFSWRRAPLHLLLLASALSCNGSPMGGGIAGTSSVRAPIAAFGSIFVGGIEFDISGAAITIEGDPAQASDLKLGMVASVRGIVDTTHHHGVAQQVATEHLGQGPLDAVDVAHSTLTMLAQQILVDARTVFDPVPFEALRPGDDVEVSGFFDSTGRIRATRVVKQAELSDIELKGYVQDLDPSAQTFRLGDLVVEFADAFIQGAPSGGLQNGLFVDIGADEPATGDVIRASSIDVEDPSLMADPGDALKVEGYVTAIVSPTEFVVDGSQRVRLTSETHYEHGTQLDLAIDAHVDVEGVAEVGGELVAGKVDFVGR